MDWGKYLELAPDLELLTLNQNHDPVTCDVTGVTIMSLLIYDPEHGIIAYL